MRLCPMNKCAGVSEQIGGQEDWAQTRDVSHGRGLHLAYSDTHLPLATANHMVKENHWEGKQGCFSQRQQVSICWTITSLTTVCFFIKLNSYFLKRKITMDYMAMTSLKGRLSILVRFRNFQKQWFFVFVHPGCR